MAPHNGTARIPYPRRSHVAYTNSQRYLMAGPSLKHYHTMVHALCRCLFSIANDVARHASVRKLTSCLAIDPDRSLCATQGKNRTEETRSETIGWFGCFPSNSLGSWYDTKTSNGRKHMYLRSCTGRSVRHHASRYNAFFLRCRQYPILTCDHRVTQTYTTCPETQCAFSSVHPTLAFMLRTYRLLGIYLSTASCVAFYETTFTPGTAPT